MKLVHLVLGTALAGLAMQSVPAHAASGDLDTEFGTNGGWSAFQSGNVDTRGVDAQPAADGGWFVLARTADGTNEARGTAAATNRPMLFKTRADGTLDSAFGTLGKAYGPLLNVHPGSSGTLVRHGGRLYAVMSEVPIGAPTKTYVIAFDLYGRMDPAFGNQGVATIASGALNSYHPNAAMVGDHLVIVDAGRPNGATFNHFMVTKLRPNGQPDPTFGANGVVFHALHGTTGSDNKLTDVVALANGKLLVAGRARAKVGETEMVVARLHANGALDTTFGIQGYSAVKIYTGNNYGRRIVVQSDGRIVVGGSVCHPYDWQTDDEACAAGFARLYANGALDHSFGNDGKMAVSADPPGKDPDTYLYDLTIDRVGRVVASGVGSSASDPTNPSTYQQNGVLIRLGSTGQPDATFGQQGVARFEFSAASSTLMSVKVASVGTSWRLFGIGYSDVPTANLVISRHHDE